MVIIILSTVAAWSAIVFFAGVVAGGTAAEKRLGCPPPKPIPLETEEENYW